MYLGNTWDTSSARMTLTVPLDGADYSGTYGITTGGNSLKLDFVTQSSGKNIGSRTYLMADYEIFDLLDKEFTFDVDVSNLPCGLNGAL